MMPLKNNFKHKILQGFTLIEVLLGLTIFSIIALTLYNTFQMGLKVDYRSKEINQGYQEAYDAFALMSKDLENALVYDFSASYPQEVSFDGQGHQMSFLSSTKKGISRVSFYTGIPNWGKVTQVIIAQHTQRLKQGSILSKENTSVEFLIRQEKTLPEYLSKKKDVPEGEVIVGGLKKEGIKWQYGSIKRDSNGRMKDIEWKDQWHDNALPNVVRIEMILWDSKSPQEDVILKRDIYLPRIESGQ
ncbi:MAG: prepilin-type N-terminal cleavage/methylation domain-containing protein [Candidatus Omnitrophica bacterium]|nr:prepilin-type N-terminal cleavage/methylation domain-containing protein [Candidatus Omnitrophota bacterium]